MTDMKRGHGHGVQGMASKLLDMIPLRRKLLRYKVCVMIPPLDPGVNACIHVLFIFQVHGSYDGFSYLNMKP